MNFDYNITSLHKTLSGDKKTRPALFFGRNRTGHHLSSEIKSISGKHGGTYGTKNAHDAYKSWLNGVDKVKTSLQRQYGALCAIEHLLGIELIREYKVLDYFIDGYDQVNNVAYEIDEQQHFRNDKLKDECVMRQKAIESEIGCRFVRIDVRDKKPTEAQLTLGFVK